MLLAIDIGNSFTKFGIFESASLIDKFSIPTARDYTFEKSPLDRLRHVDSVFISSVVPESNQPIVDSLKKLFNVQPHLIDHTFDFWIEVNYSPPESAGVDRLVNASSAAAKYGSPVIVCSFGTASTFDVVTENDGYIGGAIAPGMAMLAETLHRKTSKLPLVNIAKPENAIGRTTEDSIKSGIFHGGIGMIEGILMRIFEELGPQPKVVATGGFAKTVAAESSMIDVVDEDLTLNGIRLIAERRKT